MSNPTKHPRLHCHTL